jgi:hypothetical protein
MEQICLAAAALPFGLFGLLQPMTLAQSHAGAASVLVDDFDASSDTHFLDFL